ncbi:hypothetical protein BJI67_14200 [Acidihalobacter aeolianus]|uniref:Copper resistance protein D domain-containing protein n=1 Tax=Acidihalobacter aeolianus TaxID=2792603 RepID=A0A1D8KAQ8_9GAMM|nr:CopD family protein [Acidihalobacter aeolianus]AOV18060.1 hypothetical protein BJI67_14200 [Acidihalobacter aeolianus]
MLMLLLTLHLLSAVVWVGGMFFAYVALRPAAVAVLEPPPRLRLWEATFARFFPWVWLAVILLLGTGLWMMFAFFGGMKSAPYIHAMFGIGIVMMLIYAHIFFAPYRRLRQANAAENFAEGGRRLGQIRKLIGVNLMLGLVVIVIAGLGPTL